MQQHKDHQQKMAHFSQHASYQSTHQAGEPNGDFDQTHPDEYLPRCEKRSTWKALYAIFSLHTRYITPTIVKV